MVGNQGEEVVGEVVERIMRNSELMGMSSGC